MLRRLTVENYALIEHLELDLSPSLNIITGQTGAGKSILLGALGLLLGNRNESGALKDPTRNCVVEGTFDIAGYALEPLFEQHDLEFDPLTTVRRVITPAGKSRAYVNDLPVQLAQLRELGSRLLDIHSQHQNLLLTDDRFRTGVVDAVAGNAELLARYRAEYDRLGELRRQLTRMREESAAARRDEEWLRFQVEELAAAALKQGEQQELEAEQAELANADAIREAMLLARDAMDDEQFGILARLKGIEHALAGIRATYPAAVQMVERFRAAAIELKDLEAEITRESERIEADPARLERVDARLSLLYSLQAKHRVASCDELLTLHEGYAARLAAIESSDEAIAALEAQLAQSESKARELAHRIGAARRKAAPAIEAQIAEMLARLGMPGAVVAAEVTAAEALRPDGADRIRLLFSANRNVAPQPVERIASGGEISRVMLSIKALVARTMRLPTIIFDEIDTGVSGPIADAMGRIICKLAASMQVVNITHLPQVASKGDTHFVVYKEEAGPCARTRIARLGEEQRVEEIAKMLSGERITPAALEQARILLSSEGQA